MNLLKSASTVSLLTLLSRISGLVREVMVAKLFGASEWTDAFNVAFRLPNLLRRLFAEGAFSQAFVPLLNQRLQARDQQQSRAFVSAVATVLFWALLLVCVLGVVAAPWLTWMIASGLPAPGFDAATVMVRIMFPYIGLISMVSLASALLNAYGYFAIPAATPILLNVGMVLGGWWCGHFFTQPIYGLAFGVMLGGVSQCAWQWWALRRYVFLPGISRHVVAASRHEGVRQVLKNMLPAIFAVSVAQLSLLINTQIASHLVAGSVSWLSYADRLMEFPTALLGVALSVVLLPHLSRSVVAEQFQRFDALLDWGLRLVLLLALPASLAMLVFAVPLVEMLFHYGKFQASDVTHTAYALSAYGAGLLGLIAVKVLAPGFYARQDTRTPAKIAVFVLLATQVANAIFVPYFQHVGLALSISVGAWIHAYLLYRGLRRRGLYSMHAGFPKLLLRIAVALLPMFGLLWWMRDYPFATLAALPRVGAVLAVGSLSVLIYGLTLWLVGVRGKDLRSPPV